MAHIKSSAHGIYHNTLLFFDFTRESARRNPRIQRAVRRTLSNHRACARISHVRDRGQSVPVSASVFPRAVRHVPQRMWENYRSHHAREGLQAPDEGRGKGRANRKKQTTVTLDSTAHAVQLRERPSHVLSIFLPATRRKLQPADIVTAHKPAATANAIRARTACDARNRRRAGARSQEPRPRVGR